jgi:5-methyltetrahydrofolate--homocysteine methyltransferase
MMTPYLVSKLRRFVKIPLICKPNAGNPVIDCHGVAQYDLPAEDFGAIVRKCAENGATLLGGCCGTDPEYIRHII